MNRQERTPEQERAITLLITFVLTFVVCFLLGCASYTTLQVDTFYSGTNIVRQATTHVTIRTFASAKSELAKSSVTQASHSMTNVMQYSRIGSISQQATNNIPEIAKETATGVIEGLKLP